MTRSAFQRRIAPGPPSWKISSTLGDNLRVMTSGMFGCFVRDFRVFGQADDSMLVAQKKRRARDRPGTMQSSRCGFTRRKRLRYISWRKLPDGADNRRSTRSPSYAQQVLRAAAGSRVWCGQIDGVAKFGRRGIGHRCQIRASTVTCSAIAQD